MRKNNLVQTLESWGPTFTISVEIKISSFQAQEAGHHGEILRLTSRPGDCCLMGQRVPAVFLSTVTSKKLFVRQSKCILCKSNVTEPSSSSKSFYITMNIGKNFDKKFSIDGLKEQTWYKMVLSQQQIGVKTSNY